MMTMMMIRRKLAQLRKLANGAEIDEEALLGVTLFTLVLGIVHVVLKLT